MKYFKNFAAIVAAVALAVPVLTGAQTFDDHTKIRILRGTAENATIPKYECPAGSTYSGGQCVLISNHATGVRSWTSYFLGQTRCKNSSLFTYCSKILSDGRIQFGMIVGGGNFYPIEEPRSVPFGLESVVGPSNSAFSQIAVPTNINSLRLHGTPPTDFELAVSETPIECNGCAGTP